MTQLTKSQYLSAVHCRRRAYLERHSPELAKAPSTADVERMRAGQEIGKLARTLFRGTLIETPSYDLEKAAAETLSVIASGTDTVYEATFVTDEYAARVDILQRVSPDEWHIIEVKSSKTAKAEHIWDAGFQRLVVQSCGLNVARVSLLLIRDGFVGTGGPVDPDQFFVLEDVTQGVEDAWHDIMSACEDALVTRSQPSVPEVVPNVHCKRDGECPFLAHCWQGLPRYDVTTLPYIKSDFVLQVHAIGARDIRSLPSDLKLSARQKLISDVVRTNVPFVSPDLHGVLSNIAMPAHFLDFEATSSAIPVYAGVAPYRHIPFQWSDHIFDGERVRHADFLHRERSDPRAEFVESLHATLTEAGTVCYYSSYEKTILRSLAGDGVPYAPETLAILEERGLDLESVVKDHVYLAEFMGRTSIKAVYPALVPDSGYKDLAIQDGETAAAEFRRMLSPATTPEESASIADALLQYCHRDTLAMLEVYRSLVRLAEAPSSPNGY